MSVLDHGARNESRIRIIRLASSTSNLLWSASYKPRFPSEATTRSLFHPAKALTGKSVACLLIKPSYYFYMMSQRHARRSLHDRLTRLVSIPFQKVAAGKVLHTQITFRLVRTKDHFAPIVCGTSGTQILNVQWHHFFIVRALPKL